MITSNRIVKLDMARTFAILCVVLCHCSEMIYTQQSVKVAELGISSRIFMFGTFTIGRLGVPIFLYLSGILLLKKTIDSDEDIFKFYKNNLFPLFVVNEIWVIVKDIEIFSCCEHHLALMYDMSVTVAYIPKDRVIGLSKIARICDMVGKRLQLQERIGRDIAYIVSKIINSEDIAVLIKGKHSCMTARGINKTNSFTETSTFMGEFKKNYVLQNRLFNRL